MGVELQVAAYAQRVGACAVAQAVEAIVFLVSSRDAQAMQPAPGGVTRTHAADAFRARHEAQRAAGLRGTVTGGDVDRAVEGVGAVSG